MSYQDVVAPMEVRYDRRTDLVTINGIRYAGELFRALSLAAPGTWLRIHGREPSGKISVQSVPESVERTFDAISGLAPL